MLRRIADFFTAIVEGRSSARFAPDDYRLAAAVMLVQVSAVDGDVAPVERGKLGLLLGPAFDLSPRETEDLIEAALAAGRENADIADFAAILARALEPADRERIVAMMWDLALVDGHAGEFEESAIARAARLLGVESEAAFAQRPRA